MAAADAVRVLERLGAKPSDFARLLARLDNRNCGKSGCGPGWLNDHPETEVRIDHLRALENKK